MHRARAGPEDFADVLVGLALDHPVEHLRLAPGELEGMSQRLDRRLVRFLAHADQPLALGSAVVQRDDEPPRTAGERQRQAVATVCAGCRGALDPVAQATWRDVVLRAGELLEQFPRQRRLPHQATVGNAHRQRGLAKGVERAARLLGQACAVQMGVDAGEHLAGRMGLVT